MVTTVELTKTALKQLSKAPQHIAKKLQVWVTAVELRGVEAVRKVPSFRDEPLKGALAGKRSIRLSLQWRANYQVLVRADGKTMIEFIEVQEVHPHAY